MSESAGPAGGGGGTWCTIGTEEWTTVLCGIVTEASAIVRERERNAAIARDSPYEGMREYARRHGFPLESRTVLEFVQWFETKQPPSKLRTAVLAEWNEYKRLLYEANRKKIVSILSREPGFWSKYLAGLRFSNLFDNNAFWYNVPGGAQQGRSLVHLNPVATRLLHERPVLDEEDAAYYGLTRKRRRLSAPEEDDPTTGGPFFASSGGGGGGRGGKGDACEQIREYCLGMGNYTQQILLAIDSHGATRSLRVRQNDVLLLLESAAETIAHDVGRFVEPMHNPAAIIQKTQLAQEMILRQFLNYSRHEALGQLEVLKQGLLAEVNKHEQTITLRRPSEEEAYAKLNATLCAKEWLKRCDKAVRDMELALIESGKVPGIDPYCFDDVVQRFVNTQEQLQREHADVLRHERSLASQVLQGRLNRYTAGRALDKNWHLLRLFDAMKQVMTDLSLSPDARVDRDVEIAGEGGVMPMAGVRRTHRQQHRHGRERGPYDDDDRDDEAAAAAEEEEERPAEVRDGSVMHITSKWHSLIYDLLTAPVTGMTMQWSEAVVQYEARTLFELGKPLVERARQMFIDKEHGIVFQLIQLVRDAELASRKGTEHVMQLDERTDSIDQLIEVYHRRHGTALSSTFARYSTQVPPVRLSSGKCESFCHRLVSLATALLADRASSSSARGDGDAEADEKMPDAAAPQPQSLSGWSMGLERVRAFLASVQSSRSPEQYWSLTPYVFILCAWLDHQRVKPSL